MGKNVETKRKADTDQNYQRKIIIQLGITTNLQKSTEENKRHGLDFNVHKLRCDHGEVHIENGIGESDISILIKGRRKYLVNRAKYEHRDANRNFREGAEELLNIIKLE